MAFLKMRGGKWMIDVEFTVDKERLTFKFNYNEYLKDRLKMMDGCRWNPETKEWSCINNQRNLFQLSYLMGNNPYAQYDQPLLQVIPEPKACFRCKYGQPKVNCRLCQGKGVIDIFQHQVEMFQ